MWRLCQLAFTQTDLQTSKLYCTWTRQHRLYYCRYQRNTPSRLLSRAGTVTIISRLNRPLRSGVDGTLGDGRSSLVSLVCSTGSCPSSGPPKSMEDFQCCLGPLARPLARRLLMAWHPTRTELTPARVRNCDWICSGYQGAKPPSLARDRQSALPQAANGDTRSHAVRVRPLSIALVGLVLCLVSTQAEVQTRIMQPKLAC
ncbi:hypothetical protein B0T24DRAFT_223198 [Lasiosphaeria ovina]|uniref:Uncharacterized protein n=1 Tax=Lasiosphaeria ovina TaxID=92902 RepID=A0AAE0KI25_9PEZI|nr:hypothetical protein B0T24DRAFT_223198 [Lasiosphaeria ovina]